MRARRRRFSILRSIAAAREHANRHETYSHGYRKAYRASLHALTRPFSGSHLRAPPLSHHQIGNANPQHVK
jgi:hypothetical protein